MLYVHTVTVNGNSTLQRCCHYFCEIELTHTLFVKKKNRTTSRSEIVTFVLKMYIFAE